MRDAVMLGQRVIIGEAHEFSEKEIGTLQNIADAGGTTIARVVRRFAACGLEARGTTEGAMDLLYETANAEGVDLATELFDAIFDDYYCEWSEPVTADGFLRDVTAPLDESVSDAVRAIVVSIAHECLAGRGREARRQAMPLFDSGAWTPNAWDVGYAGWVADT